MYFRGLISPTSAAITAYAVHVFIDDNGKRKSLYMHRVIMRPPIGMTVDHDDRNGLHNFRSNLRVCPQGDNNKNMPIRKRRQYKGVRREGERFFARIDGGKRYRRGTFATPIEAARAYDAMAKELHGEFAATNFD